MGARETPNRRRPFLPLIAAVFGLGALLATACAASSQAQPQPTATPPAPGSALARLYELLDAINTDDFAAAYEIFAPEVQQEMTLQQFIEGVEGVEQGGGGNLQITILAVNQYEEEGDLAEFEVTLRAEAGPLVQAELRQVAIFVRIDGVWRIADHFVQTALVAFGLSTPGPLERELDGQGCLVGDLLEGVYAPGRLQVLDPCVTTSGVVHDLTDEIDGDITFNLKLPPEDEHLLHEGNYRHKNGMLHIEIIPGDQQRLPAPREGDQMRVTGAWVFDTVHGWNEIHPVWSIEPLEEPPSELPETGFGPDSY